MSSRCSMGVLFFADSFTDVEANSQEKLFGETEVAELIELAKRLAAWVITIETTNF